MRSNTGEVLVKENKNLLIKRKVGIFTQKWL